MSTYSLNDIGRGYDAASQCSDNVVTIDASDAVNLLSELTIGNTTVSNNSLVTIKGTSNGRIITSINSTSSTDQLVISHNGDNVEIDNVNTSTSSAIKFLSKVTFTSADTTCVTANLNNSSTSLANTQFVQNELDDLRLGELFDVTITNATSGHFLHYDGSNWENITPELNHLNDVTIGTLGTNHVLYHNGSTWINSPLDTSKVTENPFYLYYTDSRVDTRISNTSINALSDVDTTGSSNGKILKYNSTNSRWEVADDGGIYTGINGVTVDNSTNVISIGQSVGTTDNVRFGSVDADIAKTTNLGIYSASNVNITSNSYLSITANGNLDFFSNTGSMGLYVQSGGWDVYANTINFRNGAGTVLANQNSFTNWDTAFGWGNHANAGYLRHSMTIIKNGHQFFTINGGGNGIWYGGSKITNWTIQSQSSSQWNSSNNWWVCPSAGVYLILGAVITAGGSTNITNTELRLYKNNSFFNRISWMEFSRVTSDDDDAQYVTLPFNYSIYLNRNDTLYLYVSISSKTYNSTGIVRLEGTSLTMLKLS